MFTLRQLIRHPEYQRGVRDMLSVAPGLAAWGMMTGVAMIKSGMSLFESVAMTLLVYAGSSQLAAIPLIAAGAPVAVILAAAFCVNLRFVVFSLHMRPYLMHLPRGFRLFIGYLVADTSYAMFTRRYPHPVITEPSAAPGRPKQASAPSGGGEDTTVPSVGAQQQAQVAYLLGGCATCWGSWQLASLLGIALAHSVPPHWGLGFAGILALLGMTCSLASTKLRLVSGGVAGAAAVAAFALPFKLNIVVAIAAAVALSLLLEKAPLARRERT